MTTKADEPLPAIDQTIPINANTNFDNSGFASQNETDTSSATTISYGSKTASDHTMAAYENTTNLFEVTAPNNKSKSAVVASTDQAAFPLDNHESAFNAAIPEFDETESARSNETETEVLPVVNNTTILPEISVATLTAGITTSVSEHGTLFRNTSLSYKNLNENKTIPEPQDSKLNIQQENVQDIDVVDSNSTTATNDKQIEISATTTRTDVTIVADFAENATDDKTSDQYTMTTKADEQLPAINQSIPINAITDFDNSGSASQNETDTSSATTISYGSKTADDHTAAAYKNPTTFSQVTAPNNISKSTVVASTDQAVYSLDIHESALNATIPEFDETESARSNEAETEMLPVVNNTTITPEISVATLTAGATSSVFGHETAFRNTTIFYENLNENKTIPEPQDSKLNTQQENVQDVDIVLRNSTTTSNDTTTSPINATDANRNTPSSLPFNSFHVTDSITIDFSNFLDPNETVNDTIAAKSQSSKSSPNELNSTLSTLQLIFSTSIEPDGDMIFPNDTHPIMEDATSSIAQGGTTEHTTTSQGEITNSILISALTSAIQRDDTIHGANLTNDPPVGNATGNLDSVRSGSGTAIHHLMFGLWILTTSILCSV